MLTARFFRDNRINLRQRVGEDGLVVITAQSLLQRSGDTVYPFRQDSNFLYLTGVQEPDVILVMHGGEEFLILPKRSETETIFGGAVNCDEIAKISGITNIYNYREGWGEYKKLQQDCKKVYNLGAAPTKVSGLDTFATNPARRHLIRRLKRLFPGIAIHDIRPELIQMRQVKQSEEITVLKEAIAITKEGFGQVKDYLKPAVHEYELEAVFDLVFKRRNAIHGYAPPMIAAGKNACTLHYNQRKGKVAAGDLVLFDVGAEHQNYTADISRTYSVGRMNERQHRVHEAVKRVQVAAIGLLRDELPWRDYVLRVDEIMGVELIKLGLIKHNIRSEVKRYFPHGISHSLGLDAHDSCDYQTLRENMVITVEPGIYIPEEGIGVRIEDDILITNQGALNLSEDIPYY